MGDDQLARPCIDDVGVADSVGARWSLGGGAWVICVVDCCGCLSGVTCFTKTGQKTVLGLRSSPVTKQHSRLFNALRICIPDKLVEFSGLYLKTNVCPVFRELGLYSNVYCYP